MTREIDNLLKWVKEYEIEQEIRDKLCDGYWEAVLFVETYFDGWGEAERIVSYYAQ